MVWWHRCSICTVRDSWLLPTQYQVSHIKCKSVNVKIKDNSKYVSYFRESLYHSNRYPNYEIVVNIGCTGISPDW